MDEDTNINYGNNNNATNQGIYNNYQNNNYQEQINSNIINQEIDEDLNDKLICIISNIVEDTNIKNSIYDKNTYTFEKKSWQCTALYCAGKYFHAIFSKLINEIEIHNDQYENCNIVYNFVYEMQQCYQNSSLYQVFSGLYDQIKDNNNKLDGLCNELRNVNKYPFITSCANLYKNIVNDDLCDKIIANVRELVYISENDKEKIKQQMQDKICKYQLFIDNGSQLKQNENDGLNIIINLFNNINTIKDKNGNTPIYEKFLYNYKYQPKITKIKHCTLIGGITLIITGIAICLIKLIKKNKKTKNNIINKKKLKKTKQKIYNNVKCIKYV